MILLIVRGLFILMSTTVATMYVLKLYASSIDAGDSPNDGGLSLSLPIVMLTIILSVVVSSGIVFVDIFARQKRLSSLSGLLLGLITGMVAAYAVSFLIEFVGLLYQGPAMLVEGIKVYVGVLCIFITTTVVLQTKDDFRFVIPYVEFAKQIRGTRPLVLDSSALIDGRIVGVAETQVLQSPMIIPRIVINEIQQVADSRDRLKRTRGRRGLDMLAKLQAMPFADVSIEDSDGAGSTVDERLVSLAEDYRAHLVTTDFNLEKVAAVRGVSVINLNNLAQALRPVFLPGEAAGVQIVREGESAGQGVGYLDDGTMVVVQDANDKIGQTVDMVVTSMLQTSAGRMIFGKLDTDPASQSSRQARDEAGTAV